MTLGRRIQELRKQAGLSQEGLGEALGVSRQAVSKWEADGGIPELDTLIAMSKMFGIPIGQLLGVEEPKKEEEATASPDEERIEAILRRYAEECRVPGKEEPEQKTPAGSWIIAGCAVVLAVVMLVIGIGKVRGVFDTIRNLQSQLSALQSNLDSVRGQVSNISGSLREQVEQALEEGDRLISTCAYEVVNMDPAEQTVTIRFDATLKEYTAGSRLQFLVRWIKTDRTEGQTEGDWLTGPDFSGEITIPMNYHTELTIRVEDGAGNIRERFVDYIYEIHPERFELDVYNLMAPFKLTIGRRQTAVSEQAYVNILSGYPDFVWPERAEVSVFISGSCALTEVMTVTRSEDDGEMFLASLEGCYREFTLREGDSFFVGMKVTDNLGRVKEFTRSGKVCDGELETGPEEAPVIDPD